MKHHKVQPSTAFYYFLPLPQHPIFNTLIIWSSLNVQDQISRPRTTIKRAINKLKSYPISSYSLDTSEIYFYLSYT